MRDRMRGCSGITVKAEGVGYRCWTIHRTTSQSLDGLDGLIPSITRRHKLNHHHHDNLIRTTLSSSLAHCRVQLHLSLSPVHTLFPIYT